MNFPEAPSEPQNGLDAQPAPPISILETSPPSRPEPTETRFLKWIVFGPQGVRVGWSVTLFLILAFLCMGILAAVPTMLLGLKSDTFTPGSSMVFELVQFLGLAAAAAACASLERRSILDYNLRDARRLGHCFAGLLGGFIALSALVEALHLGGWLRFGPVSLSGTAIVTSGALWGIAFLFTGLSEEGMTRCYMLFTLARGVNYWWALGTVASFSFFAWLNTHGSGAGGVYLMAALGVVPCLYLHLKKSPSAGFWEAAWLTSTFFGYIHTFNAGETWVGIFAAAAIGFVFCVSVRLTGSAWWAIGFHAAWDWAQTFFYGTADSGLQPTGHLMTTNTAGAALWSGGSDGPEGSLLILPTILLVLIVLIAIYGRKPRTESAFPDGAAQLS